MPGKEGKKKKTAQNRLSLVDDLNASRFASAKRRYQDNTEEDGEEGFLLSNEETHKIMKVARRQLQEEEDANASVERESSVQETLMEGYDAEVDYLVENDYEESKYDERDDDNLMKNQYAEEGDVELEYDDLESVSTEVEDFDDDLDQIEMTLDSEEARLLQKFNSPTGMQKRNLADIIMEKINEQKSDKQHAGRMGADGSPSGEPHVDKRVSRVYIAIGHVLKHYTAGKIPKAFKVLPHIQNWEELLMLTNPHEWSPHATYRATRIFSANLNEKMAQRFYATILLPIVMDKLSHEKKLHPALYMAIKKALFKPVAFFKGFLIPLVQDDECTLRMALVVGSILQKCHLPPIPTAVSIVKITMLPFRGPNVVLLRVLIDKKMTFPYQAIDALVKYFHKFTKTHVSKEDILPVLWHQTLLCFAQRYKVDLTIKQIELLREVCNKHFHHLITPETRRELNVAAQRLVA